MSDIELLKMAAKAAGIVGTYADHGLVAGIYEAVTGGSDIPWNPLHNDGQALRLAVKLRVDFKCVGETVRAWVGDPVAMRVIASVEEFCGSDPYAATRRAIVRAAAAIAGAAL